MSLIVWRKNGISFLAITGMLLTLAACGGGATGGAPSAPSVPPTASRAPTVQATQTSVGAAEPTSVDTVVASHGGPVKDPVSLIDALRKAGASVTPKDPIEQPFLSVTGTQLVVNGADVQVFEYADEATAQADAAKVADMFAGRGTMMIDWVGSPHAYRAGRVIALYVGDDAAMLRLLRETLGAPFAEQPRPPRQEPTTNPAAPTAATSHGAGQVTDLVGLVDQLRAAGFDVKPAGDVSQPFFEQQGSLLTVNGADVQVFEFADTSAAKTAVRTIGADGNPPNAIIEWVAPPHFYQAGRVVVLYVGEDKAIIAALTKALGPQVAGR